MFFKEDNGYLHIFKIDMYLCYLTSTNVKEQLYK